MSAADAVATALEILAMSCASIALLVSRSGLERRGLMRAQAYLYGGSWIVALITVTTLAVMGGHH